MYDMLSDDGLLKAREAFFKYGKTDIPGIRREVLESWIRSRKSGASANQIYVPQLTEKERAPLIKKSSLLYQTALPIMEVIYDFVKGTDILIVLADKNGIILKMLGDDNIMQTAQRQDLPFGEGSNRSEQVLGTNGIGTPLVTKKPIQLSGLEHYYLKHKNWTCSGAPILNIDGHAEGVFCISGEREKTHKHTLGIAIAAAAAISNQMHLQHVYYQTLTIKNYLQRIIDTMDRGILIVNPDLKIRKVNDYLLKMLGVPAEYLLNQPISQFIHNVKWKELNTNIDNLETSIGTDTRRQKCFIGVRCISPVPPAAARPSYMITVRDKTAVHKLVNTVIGSKAYFQFSDIIGSSAELRHAKELAQIASTNDANVLLLGPSGTGKELFAQSIHNASRRANKPFVVINCGALPRTLLESELFGYEPGAFTGAKKTGQSGKFELANGGTIFLDEIGDMPFDVQVSLLRVLQNREIVRIGATHAIPIDVRIIAATNKDLEKAMTENLFRNDLFYRLNVFSISIPSLAERRGDIIELAYYFLKKYAGHNPSLRLSDDVCQIFLRYSWPGNIRELENTIERACLIAKGNMIGTEALPKNILRTGRAAPAALTAPSSQELNSVNTCPPQTATAAETERTLIINHLVLEKGNIKRTAERLGISRRTLYRKLEKYNISYKEVRN